MENWRGRNLSRPTCAARTSFWNRESFSIFFFCSKLFEYPQAIKNIGNMSVWKDRTQENKSKTWPLFIADRCVCWSFVCFAVRNVCVVCVFVLCVELDLNANQLNHLQLIALYPGTQAVCACVCACVCVHLTLHTHIQNVQLPSSHSLDCTRSSKKHSFLLFPILDWKCVDCCCFDVRLVFFSQNVARLCFSVAAFSDASPTYCDCVRRTEREERGSCLRFEFMVFKLKFFSSAVWTTTHTMCRHICDRPFISVIRLEALQLMKTNLVWFVCFYPSRSRPLLFSDSTVTTEPFPARLVLLLVGDILMSIDSFFGSINYARAPQHASNRNQRQSSCPIRQLLVHRSEVTAEQVVAQLEHLQCWQESIYCFFCKLRAEFISQYYFYISKLDYRNKIPHAIGSLSDHRPSIRSGFPFFYPFSTPFGSSRTKVFSIWLQVDF